MDVLTVEDLDKLVERLVELKIAHNPPLFPAEPITVLSPKQFFKLRRDSDWINWSKKPTRWHLKQERVRARREKYEVIGYPVPSWSCWSVKARRGYDTV